MKVLLRVLRFQGFPFIWGLVIAASCGYVLMQGVPTSDPASPYETAVPYELLLCLGLVAGLLVAGRAWVKGARWR